MCVSTLNAPERSLVDRSPGIVTSSISTRLRAYYYNQHGVNQLRQVSMRAPDVRMTYTYICVCHSYIHTHNIHSDMLRTTTSTVVRRARGTSAHASTRVHHMRPLCAHTGPEVSIINTARVFERAPTCARARDACTMHKQVKHGSDLRVAGVTNAHRHTSPIMLGSQRAHEKKTIVRTERNVCLYIKILGPECVATGTVANRSAT